MNYKCLDISLFGKQVDLTPPRSFFSHAWVKISSFHWMTLFTKKQEVVILFFFFWVAFALGQGWPVYCEARRLSRLHIRCHIEESSLKYVYCCSVSEGAIIQCLHVRPKVPKVQGEKGETVALRITHSLAHLVLLFNYCKHCTCALKM